MSSGQDFTVLERLADDAQPVSQPESKGSKAEKRLQRQVLMRWPASHGVGPSEYHYPCGSVWCRHCRHMQTTHDVHRQTRRHSGLQSVRRVSNRQ